MATTPISSASGGFSPAAARRATVSGCSHHTAIMHGLIQTVACDAHGNHGRARSTFSMARECRR